MATNRRKKKTLTMLVAVIATAVVAEMSEPEVDCPEDAVLVWSGEAHTDCVTLDDFAGHDDWSARLGEIQAELAEEVE